MKGGAAAPWLLLLVGGLFAVSGFFVLLSHASFAFTAEHASGEIVNLQTQSHRTGRRGHHSTYADVTFKDAQGNPHTFHTQVVDNFGGWQLHERVDVLYPSGLPQLARVGGFRNQYATPLFLLLGGLFAATLGWLRKNPAQP